MLEPLPSGAVGRVRLATVDVFTGRAAEQVALAATSLVLAAQLGPSAFAPIGILLVVNSLAITMSDLGVGLRAMRLAPESVVDRRALVNVRRTSLGVAMAAIGLGAAIGSMSGFLVGVSGGLWALSGEAFIRKCAALRAGASKRVARSEVCGSAVLIASTSAAWMDEGRAVQWVAVGLLIKHLVELLLAGPWKWAFGAAITEPDWLGLWLSQAVAYVIANLDYLAVGLVLGERALSTYVVAFRLANAVPSQVAFVAARIATVDLASGQRSDRQHRYERYTSMLFLAGGTGALATAVAAPLLEVVIGDEWPGASWTLAVLALGAPWRTILGTAGTLAIISESADRLLRWEVLRVTIVGTAYLAAAALGYQWLVASVVVVPVASTLVYHHRAGALAGVRPWWALPHAAVATLLVLACAIFIGSSALSLVT